MIKRHLFQFFSIILFLLFAGCISTCADGSITLNPSECPSQPPSITIANWNVQILGDSKEAKPELMAFYADTIKKYDIVFIQEIRDADGSVFPALCSRIPEYNCNISSRAGRSSSKEQIGIIYRKDITLLSLRDFNPDSMNRWERPPVMAEFDADGYHLSIYNIHTKPTDVPSELGALESIALAPGNAIVLGDLNADCAYYSPKEHIHFLSWKWIIPDNADTTVHATDCAYDRIIMNPKSFAEFLNYGIYTEGINSSVSDHYLVWVNITTQEN